MGSSQAERSESRSGRRLAKGHEVLKSYKSAYQGTDVSPLQKSDALGASAIAGESYVAGRSAWRLKTQEKTASAHAGAIGSDTRIAAAAL